MKSGSSDNSLKSSGTEMSLSTSNILWHWRRNVGRLQSNCISKAFPNESTTPRITWIHREDGARHTVNWAFLYLCRESLSSVFAAGSRRTECAESSLVQHIHCRAIQQNEWEAVIKCFYLNWPSFRRWCRSGMSTVSLHCCSLTVFSQEYNTALCNSTFWLVNCGILRSVISL